jgi:hypothetical protein
LLRTEVGDLLYGKRYQCRVHLDLRETEKSSVRENLGT